MKVGEYCTFDKHVVKCVEATDDNPCEQCCLYWKSACLTVRCMETNRCDHKAVYFKQLGFRRKKYNKKDENDKRF